MDKDFFIQDFYENYYNKVFSQTPILKYAYKKTHRVLEQRYNPLDFFPRILEIGGGQGEHFPYVRHNFDDYTIFDIREIPKSLDERIEYIQHDCSQQLSIPRKFDRIISTCVLHHIDDSYSTLQNIRSWLEIGGLFDIFLPCDPGVLNRISRKFVWNPLIKRSGYGKYELLNALEHRNHFWSLLTQIKDVFKDDQLKIRWLPSLLPTTLLNFFVVISIKKNI